MSTRVEIGGKRHYNCAGVPKPLPSVTTILSSTQSAETQRKLAHWNQLNPGVADKAAERGTWIHSATENYIRGLTVKPPKEYEPYWEGMPDQLDELLEGGKVLWSEAPLNQPQWNQFVGDDGVGRIHYYDAQAEQGYAGCCDIIYKDKNGEIILGDFKTSVGPYSYRFPNKSANLAPDVKKALISGVFKLKKTTLQLAAYTLAAENCLGIKIDKTQIVVSTPTETWPVQVFTFGAKELEKHTDQWLSILRQYYREMPVAA